MATLAELFANRQVSGMPSGGKDLLRRTYDSLPQFARSERSELLNNINRNIVPEVEYKRTAKGTRPQPNRTSEPALAEILASRQAAPQAAPQGSFADQLMALRQQQLQQYLQPQDPWQRIGTTVGLAATGRPDLLVQQARTNAYEDQARQQEINQFIGNEQAQSQAELDYQLARGKAAYEKLQKDGEDMAAAIGEFTQDPDEQALLTWAVGQELQAAGTDDDNWTPLDRRQVVSQIYARLRESGQLRGPRQEAPETRTVQRGGRVFTEEFNPYTGTWSEIGAGPKWNPTEGGGQLTLPQQANNSEIDSARARLMELSRTLPQGQTLQDAILENLQKVDPFTGLPQPGYNPFLDSTARLAMQHKTGDDLEHQKWSRLIMSPAPVPIPETQVPDLSGYSNPVPQGGAAAGQGTMNLGAAPRVPASPRPTVTPGAPAGSRDISQMSVPELGQLFQDPNLTQAQRDEISARLSALGY